MELESQLWQQQWNPTTWKQYLLEAGAEADAKAIRQCTHTGRPLGAAEFIESLEKIVGRVLTPQKGGRPRKSVQDRNLEFGFD